jgi:magnesium chelatase subunit D
VGQPRLKRALLLCAINPRIGGVLIRGEKGTAKSTAVRGLARLLPPLNVVADCPYSCPPDAPAAACAQCQTRYNAGETLPTTVRPTRLVELPVSASEDRVVGSLDLEHAISEGQRRFEPGLLAQVNRGVLYVDEVNLLDDHLVDVLLDAAAMGVNTVEREGISISHPSRFMLVGTMNPEEGELRPQLLDRFGLAVDIGGLSDLAERVAVIERRMAYEEDAESFSVRWEEQEREIAERIQAARDLLPLVMVQPIDMTTVAGLVLELDVDGHRADLTILETARTHAAWAGRNALTTEDIQLAAELALPHRLRRQPFSEARVDEQSISEAIERSNRAAAESSAATQQADEKKNTPGEVAQEQPGAPGGSSGGTTSSGTAQGSSVPAQEKKPDSDPIQQADDPFRVEQQRQQHADRRQRRAGGRRSRTRTTRKQGRYITSRKAERVTDLAFDATMREAAPYQPQRRQSALEQADRSSGPRLLLHREDLRQKVRVRRTRNAVCFVVDASWSMAAEERMRTTKSAILSLLHDAYQQRDRVGLVSFQRSHAHVLLPLTNSVELAQKRLQTMPTGGKTPLARGMLTGFELLHRARQQDPEVIPLMVLITDGQANVAIGNVAPQIEAYQIAAAIAEQDMRAVVIDTEHPHFDRGLTRQLAQYLQGHYYHLDELRGEGLVQMVRTQMGS